MAHDLFSKSTSGRNWARESSPTDSNGQDKVIVVKESGGMGLLGWVITISLGSRVLTGKWPWYWAGHAAKRLEAHDSRE